jgi:hypothetical protein
MRKIAIIPVVCGILLMAGFGALQSQQSPDDPKFSKLVDTYLESYWKFYPTAGTMAGFNKFNGLLEDFSESVVDKRGIEIEAINKELMTKISVDKLSPEVKIDREILLDAIEYDLFRLERLVPQEYNPLHYNDILLNSIRSLLAKDFAPLDARLKSATERAKKIPELVKQAKANLKTPAKEYTEAAIRQIPAILDFYITEVPKLAESASPAVKTPFMAEHAKVIAALTDYQKFLQTDLLAKSTGNFRLGPEAHAKILRLTCQTTAMFDEFNARAKADSNNIRREMFLVCIPYYKIMDPKFDIDNPPQNMSGDRITNAVISNVLAHIQGDQPTKDEWISKVKASADDIKAFLAKTKLLDVPEEPLQIEAMTALNQGSMLSKLLAPGPYDPAGSYTALIRPVPEEWTPEQIKGFFDEYNNFMIPMWTIEKIYPGSFFPAAFSRKGATLIRKMYPSQPLLRGWPLYTDEMYISAGLNSYDLRQRLNQLKLKLRAVLDYQLDLGIHQGGLTKEQAMRVWTITGFMSQPEAERRWNMIVLNPVAAAYPYVGYQEILDMEKDYKQAKGATYNQKEFLQKLLAGGPLPLRTIKTRIIQ